MEMVCLVRSEVGSVRSEEATRPKEQREKKSLKEDASTLGLKIYAAVANRFLEQIIYEEIVKSKKWKI